MNKDKYIDLRKQQQQHPQQQQYQYPPQFQPYSSNMSKDFYLMPEKLLLPNNLQDFFFSMLTDKQTLNYLIGVISNSLIGMMIKNKDIVELKLQVQELATIAAQSCKDNEKTHLANITLNTRIKEVEKQNSQYKIDQAKFAEKITSLEKAFEEKFFALEKKAIGDHNTILSLFSEMKDSTANTLSAFNSVNNNNSNNNSNNNNNNNSNHNNNINNNSINNNNHNHNENKNKTKNENTTDNNSNSKNQIITQLLNMNANESDNDDNNDDDNDDNTIEFDNIISNAHSDNQLNISNNNNIKKKKKNKKSKCKGKKNDSNITSANITKSITDQKHIDNDTEDIALLWNAITSMNEKLKQITLQNNDNTNSNNNNNNNQKLKPKMTPVMYQSKHNNSVQIWQQIATGNDPIDVQVYNINVILLDLQLIYKELYTKIKIIEQVLDFDYVQIKCHAENAAMQKSDNKVTFMVDRVFPKLDDLTTKLECLNNIVNSVACQQAYLETIHLHSIKNK